MLKERLCMAETVLLKEIKQVLSKFPEYWDSDTLLKSRVSEDLRDYKPELITDLLSNEKIKEQFEVIISGTSIFKIEEFIQLLTYKDFWADSYTKYSNKIGLTANGKYLDYNSDVVLDFPFKDCFLEGGMTKEEVGKQEVYYNKVIARDEVDTLLSPKVLTNTKKYTKHNEEPVTEITDTDNLVIKGNNLLALYSLKERYAGKVKCIYIDPPYYFNKTKKEDTFLYNSNFKLSTWLTFMKNRLEIAYDLLSEEGSIFIQISEDGVSELQILLNNIFGKENFISKISIRTKSPSGFQSVNPGVFQTAEYILTYAKVKSKWDYNNQYIEIDYDSNYKWLVKNKDENYKNWKIVPLKEFYIESQGVEFSESKKQIDDTHFEKMLAQFALDNSGSVFQSVAIGNKASKIIKETRDISKKDPESIFKVEREGQYDVYIKNGRELAFYEKIVRYVNNKKVPTMQLSNIWTDIAYQGISKEGGVSLKGGKKPERLIKRILEMGTNENDLVLDFFMGSATTQAVAMKMNRQFIGVEQLNYINELSIPRLKNTLEGEQGGISKDVNWKGGGSFIYTELMDLNNQFVKQIQEAKKPSELLKILEVIKKYADLNYLVELEKLTNEPIVIDEGTKETFSFDKLSLEKRRELLIDIMDINQLYVNYSEIEDDMYHVSEEDKAFNNSFYEAGDN